MYAELLIFPDALRNQPLFPDEARALVAQATDAFPINPMILNRQADGKTVQGCYGTATDGEGWGIPPAVCFGASRGCIRIVRPGPEGGGLVINEAPALGSAGARPLR